MILYAYVFTAGFITGIGVGAFQYSLRLAIKVAERAKHE